MSGSVFDFEKTEFSGLYRLISEKIEDSGKVDIDKVPEKVHFNAIRRYLNEANMPVRKIGNRVSNKQPEQAELFMENVDVNMSPEDIADEYRKKAHREDWDITGREHHDRTVDALIEDALENPVTEDYDIVLSETFFEDPGSEQEQYEDINLENCREIASSLASDADFWKVNLEQQRIVLKEVKTRNNEDPDKDRAGTDRRREIDRISGEGFEEPEIDDGNLDSDENTEDKGEYAFEPDYGTSIGERSKAEEQIKIFEEVVKYANEVVGTEFTVEADTVYATNIIYTENIVPNVYEGEVHVSEDVEDQSLSEFEDFMDELLYGMDFQDAEELRKDQPEGYVES